MPWLMTGMSFTFATLGEVGNSIFVSKFKNLHFKKTLVFDRNRAREQYSMASDKGDISFVYWFHTKNDGDLICAPSKH